MISCDCFARHARLNVCDTCPANDRTYHIGLFPGAPITEKQRIEWITFIKKSVIPALEDHGYTEVGQ